MLGLRARRGMQRARDLRHAVVVQLLSAWRDQYTPSVSEEERLERDDLAVVTLPWTIIEQPEVVAKNGELEGIGRCRSQFDPHSIMRIR